MRLIFNSMHRFECTASRGTILLNFAQYNLFKIVDSMKVHAILYDPSMMFSNRATRYSSISVIESSRFLLLSEFLVFPIRFSFALDTQPLEITGYKYYVLVSSILR